MGFTKCIAREGAKYNIIVNAVAPSAGTNMTRTVRPENEIQALKPEYVAPLVVALSSEKPPSAGQLYEAGSGWFAATRWQRTRGVDFDFEKGIPLVEEVAKVCGLFFSSLQYPAFRDKAAHMIKVFSKICDFDDGQADNPDTPQDGSKYTMGNLMKREKLVTSSPVATLRIFKANLASRVE